LKLVYRGVPYERKEAFTSYLCTQNLKRSKRAEAEKENDRRNNSKKEMIV